MTEPLGDRLRKARQARTAIVDAAQQAAQDFAQNYTDEAKAWLCEYADAIRDEIRAYIDNQIVLELRQYADAARDLAKAYVDTQIATTAKTYVDNQIDAAKAAGKTYTDAQIAKLKADNNLI